MADVSVQHLKQVARTAPRASALESADIVAGVVLEATRRGREDLERPRFGLGGGQRRLLSQLDGTRSLDECAAAEPRLQRQRLVRDAARLVAFGLARQVRGELPQQMLVDAMNLTARIPLDRLPPLEPEQTVMPTLGPRVAPSPNGRAHLRGEPPLTAQRRRGWPIVLLAALIGATVAAISYLT